MSTATPSHPGTAEMYEQYYGFVQPPFTLTPDPKFLYRSESHDEAMTMLLQAIRRKEGFIVLTGDIGTGKTTTCRALLEHLDTATFTSLILNPFVSVEELLREVLLDFGVVSREAVRSGRVAAASTHDLISTLHEFLLSLMAINGSAVVIIDEAQHLSPHVLEQIRIISNLETNQSKLLQIVLVGQLNLLNVLAQAELRQLDQRVSIRAALKPLTRVEAEAYVGHRLGVARGSAAVHFEPEALDLVQRFTSGIPRIINLVCDRALMAGAKARVNRITPGLIEEAAATLGLQLPPEPAAVRRPRLPGRTIAALLVGGVAIAALLAWPGRSVWSDPVPPAAPVRPVLAGTEPAVPRSIPTMDFLPPPLAVPPRPRPRLVRPPEVPDDQIGLRPPAGAFEL